MKALQVPSTSTKANNKLDNGSYAPKLGALGEVCDIPKMN